jgi:hypothetical protein
VVLKFLDFCKRFSSMDPKFKTVNTTWSQHESFPIPKTMQVFCQEMIHLKINDRQKPFKRLWKTFRYLLGKSPWDARSPIQDSVH